jgi:hypothetical protein
MGGSPSVDAINQFSREASEEQIREVLRRDNRRSLSEHDEDMLRMALNDRHNNEVLRLQRETATKIAELKKPSRMDNWMFWMLWASIFIAFLAWLFPRSPVVGANKQPTNLPSQDAVRPLSPTLPTLLSNSPPAASTQSAEVPVSTPPQPAAPSTNSVAAPAAPKK